MALWEQDEAAYAGFAQTMNRTGDYLIPNFIWSDQHRKKHPYIFGLLQPVISYLVKMNLRLVYPLI